MFYCAENSIEKNNWRLDSFKEFSIDQEKYLDALELGKTPDQKHVLEFVIKGKFSTNVVSYGGHLFIDKVVQSLLENHKITGWSVYPISLVKKGMSDSFWGLAIKGRVAVKGSWDPEKGVTIGFDQQTWDGTDIFCGNDGGFKFFTKRTVDIFKENKLSGLQFTLVDPSGTAINS